jgi:dTDP-4-amino-4,6-dideoxygalactose transaminase
VSVTANFPGWPYFEKDEIDAAVRVLESGRVNYWTGNEGENFEREYARAVGVRHAVALANGTVALEFALRACGIGPGDDVVVPARTFVATATAVMVCGARPVFADVDRISGNLSADTLEAAITPATRAVVVVHVGGWPCDMDGILEVARARSLRVIEDCAQAHGAEYRGCKVGSFGDIGAFSFCQDKIITTGGEGGMAVTDSEDLWERVWSFKDHGKERSQAIAAGAVGGFRWLHESLGTNGRMTEMQAAIGRVALAKLPQRIAQRRRNAAIYDERLAAHTVLAVPVPQADRVHAYYRYHFNVRPERLGTGWSRDRILDECAAEGLPCGSGACCEVYREGVVREAGYAPTGPLEIAASLSQNALMLPVHHRLRELDLGRILDGIELILARASR